MISEMESDWVPVMPSWSGEQSPQLTHCWTVGELSLPEPSPCRLLLF